MKRATKTTENVEINSENDAGTGENSENRPGITRVLGYIRVSTDKQAESGLGLEAQKRRIIAFCEAKGWRLHKRVGNNGFYIDAGVSGKILDRPALVACIERLEPGMVLVALKLDRLMRTASDLDDFSARVQRMGADWATVEGNYDTSSAMGRFLTKIIAEIGQLEREQVGERTSQAIQSKRDRCEYFGRPPLGYKIIKKNGEKRMIIDRTEMETVRTIRCLRHIEKLSYFAIAKLMNATGRKTKNGGKWAQETIKKICVPRYFDTIADRRLPIDKDIKDAMLVMKPEYRSHRGKAKDGGVTKAKMERLRALAPVFNEEEEECDDE